MDDAPTNFADVLSEINKKGDKSALLPRILSTLLEKRGLVKNELKKGKKQNRKSKTPDKDFEKQLDIK